MQYSIVNYSEVKENSDSRIDSEYFKKTCLEIHEKIKNKGGVLFFDKIKKISSGKNLEQSEGGKYKFIRTQNIRPILIDDLGMSRVNKYGTLKPTKEGELLFVRVGEGVGNSSIITQDYSGNAISDNVLRLEIKDLNPYFCSVFFNSEIGQTYFRRVFKGTARSLISQENFKDILIPVFSDDFQRKFQKLIDQSQKLQNNLKSLYNEAENLLLEELDLKDWKPKHQLTYIKNYSDTQKAERFDAEYFQPQYDEILKKIQNYNQNREINKEVILDDIVKWSKGVEVGTEQYMDEGFDFIRISDFSTKGISEASKKISKELFVELKGKYSPRKGDILFTKDGTIGLTYLVDQNQDSIVSGAFLKLRPKIEIEAEYLTLVLNSVICKKQIEMMSGGAIIAHLKPSDAMNLQIPLLSPESQKQISSKIIESKKNNEQSKSLLEIAKKAVEMAIEDNEEKATNWIDQELEKLGVRLGKD